jgi:hypothetical protein
MHESVHNRRFAGREPEHTLVSTSPIIMKVDEPKIVKKMSNRCGNILRADQQFGAACTMKICCVVISLSDFTVKKRFIRCLFFKKIKTKSVEMEMIEEIQKNMRRSSPACGNVTCGCCSCRKEPVGSCC